MWAGWLSAAANPVPSLVEEVVGDGGRFVREKVGARRSGWLDVIIGALSDTSVEHSAGISFSLRVLVIVCVADNSGMMIDVLPDLVKAIVGYRFVPVRVGELGEVCVDNACCDCGSGACGRVVVNRCSGAGGELERNVGGVRSVLNRADVTLSMLSFTGAFEAAVLQGSPVCGDEVRNE